RAPAARQSTLLLEGQRPFVGCRRRTELLLHHGHACLQTRSGGSGAESVPLCSASIFRRKSACAVANCTSCRGSDVQKRTLGPPRHVQLLPLGRMGCGTKNLHCGMLAKMARPE